MDLARGAGGGAGIMTDDRQGQDEQPIEDAAVRLRRKIAAHTESGFRVGFYRNADLVAVLDRLDALAAERDELKRAYEQAARWHGHYVESVSDHDALAARLAAAEAANARAADRIMQGVLDLEPDDPEHPDTICISYDALVVVLENALRGADAALAGSREQAGNQARSAVSDSQGVERE